MKTFGNFITEKTLEGMLIETATLMAEKDIRPDVFLQTWYDTNEPELSAYLAEAGVWDGIKQGAQNVWQGAKAGFQQFKNTAFGPQQKFDAAIKALTSLTQAFQSDPQLQTMKGTQGQLINQIGGITKQLDQLKMAIPQFNTAAPQSGYSQPGMTPGTSPVVAGPPAP